MEQSAEDLITLSYKSNFGAERERDLLAPLIDFVFGSVFKAVHSNGKE
jgi:hypothetical protein